ncbi:MAG: zinc-dependent metalloprotease [Vulcanimicrobiaceae bacterium]
MHARLSYGMAVLAATGSLALCALSAQPASAAAKSPVAYDTFVKGATVEPGLIPVIVKNGSVYFALSKANAAAEFIETSVPSTGLGGFGPSAGEPYVAPARIFQFQRIGDRVVMRWPNSDAQVRASTPESAGIRQSLPSSIVGVVPVVAKDAATGTVVISASPFLGDVADYGAIFDREIKSPLHGYHLDPSRTFFGAAKAFAENDVLHVTQTWASADPDLVDNAPDARSLEVGMTYNIIALPHDGYMPRIADPRIGFFEQPLLDFASDDHVTRKVDYICRWNFEPAVPGKASKAKNPLVFYLSNDIPLRYRTTVRDALLTWNDAFEKIGILDAVRVEQQPAAPSWDPEDIRHNMVRWVDTTKPQYGAEALIVTDPRTGEELNVGVNVDAIEGLSQRIFRYVVAPERGLAETAANEDAFEQQYLRSVVLHESGHDLGLQHNFIGSMAYTAKDLQSKAFTNKYGVASSVMEYAPINLWPKGTPQGDYVQLVLGPYDYYAIHYGYGYVPDATTARQELPTLRRWASRWTDPTYRFASDEDTMFANGHAIDPRVQMFDLTNHPLAWCGVQMRMMHGLMNAVDQRFPRPGQPYDDARRAFMMPLYYYERCAEMPAHTIGGEYLSRAEKGDPGAGPPLQAVSRGQDLRAWHMLATGLFSGAAWRVNPSVLRDLTYSEVSSLSVGGSWAYAPTPRHDVPIVEIAGAAQNAVLNEIFAPLTLQRIDDLGTKYPRGSTMSLSDLFDWSRGTIFGNIAAADEVDRNLQTAFARRMARMWVAPAAGTPSDARALARLELADLEGAAHAASAHGRLDEQAQAHVQALASIARQALRARASVVEAPPAH